jgi:hypothetical protein
MLKLNDVGEVIATRDFVLDGMEKVTVSIGKPQQLPDHEDWYCPYRTLGVGSGKVRCAYGVDSAQALILALSMIGAELYTSDEYETGRLCWFGPPPKGDLGFPVHETIRDVLPGNKDK